MGLSPWTETEAAEPWQASTAQVPLRRVRYWELGFPYQPGPVLLFPFFPALYLPYFLPEVFWLAESRTSIVVCFLFRLKFLSLSK